MTVKPDQEGGEPSSQVQIQARALGDRTRHQIFEYLADAVAPASVSELTAHFGLNHNAIRAHLAKLVDARLVVETTAAPSGRGRPRHEYRVDPSADSRWGVTGPYEHLAILLTEVVRTGDTPFEVGRRAARGRPLTPNDAGDPIDRLVDQIARGGFAPMVERRGDTAEVVLQNCPFSSAALADPDTVCQIHLGLAHGVADTIDGLTIDELIPTDPRQARCRLRCSISTS